MRSKLPHVGTTIFTVMSALANEEKALNLSQGFPEYDCDPRLRKLVTKHLNSGHNQYAPMAGIPELRDEVVKMVQKLYGKKYDANTEITITAGATQAIFTVISTLIEPSDEVIVFTPVYDCYEPAITINGGITKYIPMLPPDFTWDWEGVKECISVKTKLIIVNSPHNPTGAVFSENDLKELTEIVDQHGLYVISDEVYEHIIFDGDHQSATRSNALSERTFIVSSFGKTFHNTGWKIGYCLAPEKLMSEFRKVHQFNVFCVNRPMQHAFAEFLSEDRSYLTLRDFYRRKRDVFLSGITNSRFKWTPTPGTYFQLLDYSEISQDFDGDFAKQMTRVNKLASIPVSAFYPKSPHMHYLRFCFAKHDETLLKAGEILSAL